MAIALKFDTCIPESIFGTLEQRRAAGVANQDFAYVVADRVDIQNQGLQGIVNNIERLEALETRTLAERGNIVSRVERNESIIRNNEALIRLNEARIAELKVARAKLDVLMKECNRLESIIKEDIRIENQNKKVVEPEDQIESFNIVETSERRSLDVSVSQIIPSTGSTIKYQNKESEGPEKQEVKNNLVPTRHFEFSEKINTKSKAEMRYSYHYRTSNFTYKRNRFLSYKYAELKAELKLLQNYVFEQNIKLLNTRRDCHLS